LHSLDEADVQLRVSTYKKRGPSKGGCITFRKSWGKWVFTRMVSGKRKYIGAFDTKKEAEQLRHNMNINNQLEGASS